MLKLPERLKYSHSYVHYTYQTNVIKLIIRHRGRLIALGFDFILRQYVGVRLVRVICVVGPILFETTPVIHCSFRIVLTIHLESKVCNVHSLYVLSISYFVILHIEVLKLARIYCSAFFVALEQSILAINMLQYINKL